MAPRVGRAADAGQLRWLALTGGDHRGRPVEQVSGGARAAPVRDALLCCRCFNIARSQPRGGLQLFDRRPAGSAGCSSHWPVVVSVTLITWLLSPGASRRAAGGRPGPDSRRCARQRDRSDSARVCGGFHAGALGAAYFPAFNVADSAITVGAACLLLDAYLSSRRASEDELMHILLANPRGFCAGVDRAIEIVERAIELFGAPIYVRHEVVHNRNVVDRLRALGAVFVEELDEVPDGATVIFRAHGVSTAVEQEAQRRGLKVFDATCPLVTKVHMEVTRFAREAREVVLIGHAGHPEVEGTMGRFDPSQGGRIYAGREPRGCRNAQGATTLGGSPSSPRPHSRSMTPRRSSRPCGCGSRRSRRRSRRTSATPPRTARTRSRSCSEHCDVLVVVGSKSSSNSNRLREMADRARMPGYLVDGAEDLRREWFSEHNTVGVTAGASAPEQLVQDVVARLREWGGAPPAESYGRPEHVVFALPRALR